MSAPAKHGQLAGRLPRRDGPPAAGRWDGPPRLPRAELPAPGSVGFRCSWCRALYPLDGGAGDFCSSECRGYAGVASWLFGAQAYVSWEAWSRLFDELQSRADLRRASVGSSNSRSALRFERGGSGGR